MILSGVMSYNGYYGKIQYSEEDKLYHIKIRGIKDSITCHGDTVDELMNVFEESVIGYIDMCKEMGKEPEKQNRQIDEKQEYKEAMDIIIGKIKADKEIYHDWQANIVLAIIEKSNMPYIKANEIAAEIIDRLGLLKNI